MVAFHQSPRGPIMTDAPHVTDVAIIGAGPVGLFGVFECGMLRMTCHVIDALDVAGGQCAALYPEKPIYDIPGYPVIEAAGLIDRLQAQAQPFNPVYHLGQRVDTVTRHGGDRWLLETSAGTRIDARCVMIAAGVGAFGPNRPPLAGIEGYEGTSVNYLVAKREAYRGNGFTCDPTGNLVHREILQPDGVTFRSRPARQGVEFLASLDEWFRPVNLVLGPDGAAAQGEGRDQRGLDGPSVSTDQTRE